MLLLRDILFHGLSSQIGLLDSQTLGRRTKKGVTYPRVDTGSNAGFNIL